MVTGVKPWLWLSPSLAHTLSPTVLSSINWGWPKASPPEWAALEWRGLHFPNRLGLAGGVDKDARNINAWWRLGAGFMEVGTITPLAQPGNTPPVVDRDVPHEALWNRLGFPSHGVDRVRARIKKLSRPYSAPLFLNIGKNASTPLDQAEKDYVRLLKDLAGLGDAFVINISSPNTQGLRELLRPERLRAFLAPLRTATAEPLLLKLSPDIQDDEVARVLDISIEIGIDGWILTNTSQGLREGLPFPKEGGVSGRPLGPRSKEFLKQTLTLLGDRRRGKLVVSVGGVMSPEDVNERLELGADLVQVYSALIFEGPLFLRKVARWQRQNRRA